MKRKPVRYMLIVTGMVLLFFLLMQPFLVYEFRDYISVLFPKGIIGIEERNLLLIVQAIMLLVVIPVYILTFIFSWRYRAHNTKATYDPDLVDHKIAEVIWWGLPLILTIVVSVLTWIKTYELDPYRPIQSDNKTLNVQVVALQWKWLFIYPEEQIATLNFFQIPTNTPVRFEITADAPMNSFWLPHLGGQIYAMPNMRTELNLIANEPGDFRGSSANISGQGFARMNFICRASSEEEYQQWVTEVKNSSQSLDSTSYAQLAKPSTNEPQFYKLSDPGLFHQVLMKFMHPQAGQ